MNVYGIGVDIVEVARIEDVIQRHGSRFLNRVFTPDEKAYCEAQHFSGPSFAARFAAKEAVAKTLGTGIGRSVALTEIEVVKNPVGAPGIQLSGRAEGHAKHCGVSRFLISLSHTRDSAVAQAIALMDS